MPHHSAAHICPDPRIPPRQYSSAQTGNVLCFLNALRLKFFLRQNSACRDSASESCKNRSFRIRSVSAAASAEYNAAPSISSRTFAWKRSISSVLAVSFSVSMMHVHGIPYITSQFWLLLNQLWSMAIICPVCLSCAAPLLHHHVNQHHAKSHAGHLPAVATDDAFFNPSKSGDQTLDQAIVLNKHDSLTRKRIYLSGHSRLACTR